MPSGEHLMEDFYYAGGLPAILREIGGFLNKDAITANGKSIWENVKDAPCWNRDVVFELDKPFKPEVGIAVLRGKLLPDGAVLTPSPASPYLMKHKRRAVVFGAIEDSKAKIDNESLDFDTTSHSVLQNGGTKVSHEQAH